MLGLTPIQTILIVAGLGVVLVGGAALYLFKKGESAGSAAVISAVQAKTIEALDAARISKETTDEEVHRTPYGDRVDGLR